jgi:sugar phosphate isomerase/epimerase
MLTKDQKIALKQTILSQTDITSVWFNRKTGEWAFHNREGFRLELTRDEVLEDLADVDVNDTSIGLTSDDDLRAALEARGISIPDALQKAPEVEGYQGMKVAELRAELEKRGVEIPTGTTLKNDLIKLLEDDDAEKAKL